MCVPISFWCGCGVRGYYGSRKVHHAIVQKLVVSFTDLIIELVINPVIKISIYCMKVKLPPVIFRETHMIFVGQVTLDYFCEFDDL